jgi:hypothetical protein
METIQHLTYEQITVLVALCLVAASSFSLAFIFVLKGIKNAGKNKVVRRHIPADKTIFGRNEPNLVVRNLLEEAEVTGKIPVSIVIEVHYV